VTAATPAANGKTMSWAAVAAAAERVASPSKPWDDREATIGMPHKLPNPSGTACYANATCQALATSVGLRSWLEEVLRTASAGTRTPAAPGSLPAGLPAVTGALALATLPSSVSESLGYKTSAGSAIAYLRGRFVAGRPETLEDQADAQEFLGWLLDTVHEEALAWEKEATGSSSGAGDGAVDGTTSESEEATEDEDNGGWVEVASGGKGKVALRTPDVGATFPESPVSHVARGLLRSVLQRDAVFTTGQDRKSASVQPFFTLPLDVSNKKVTKLTAALDRFADAEPVDVAAEKRVSFERLPRLLIIQLCRFAYDASSGRQRKIDKRLDYPFRIQLSPTWVAPSRRSALKGLVTSACYELSAVVCHAGETVASGHYTSFVRRLPKLGSKGGSQKADVKWFNADDDRVAPCKGEDALEKKNSAYLLFYSLRPKPPPRPSGNKNRQNSSHAK